MRSLLPIVILLGAPLEAQGSIVSPTFLTTTDGNSASGLPWGKGIPMRYKQVHSDVSGTPRQIKAIAFRQNAGTATFTGTRTLDLELNFGNHGIAGLLSCAIPAGYIGGATKVIARKTINLGPQGPASSPGPSAFVGMELAFDAPFAYAGVNSLGWEVQIHSNTGTGAFAVADAHVVPVTFATTTRSGVGCIATGQSSPMKSDVTCLDAQTMIYFAPLVASAPANAPLFLAFGNTDPNQVVPGLCGAVRTNLMVTLNFGSADAFGDFVAKGTLVLQARNTFAGVTLFTQFHALDPARSDAIKIASSDGVGTLFPVAKPSPTIFVSRVYVEGSATDPFAALTGDSVGMGLVTEFRF